MLNTHLHVDGARSAPPMRSLLECRGAYAVHMAWPMVNQYLLFAVLLEQGKGSRGGLSWPFWRCGC